MARNKRGWFALVCASVMLAQAGLAIAASGLCSKHCEETRAAQSKHSCCPDKAPAAKKNGCKGDCGQFCSSDSKSADFATAPLIKVPVFETAAVLPSAEATLRVVRSADVVLFESDSSPPPGTLAFSHGLRAPPAIGA